MQQGTRRPWWRSAVIYQIYIRSFADGDGDGVGDIAGIRTRLRYLRDLGVDALWITPWYVSPQVDAGYDVADFRDIDPLFGTLADAETLISEAHEHGLRVIPDIVPNHTSDRHRWFQDALAAGPGSPERKRYHFRPGRGVDGDQPPNNWPSRFGGRAWTRVTEADGRPGEWYLHLYAPEQPDLNWDNAEVAPEFESVLRFWFERGVDGFRIDVARGLAKDPALPDLVEPGTDSGYAAGTHPFLDRDEVHEIYRRWRRIADNYPGDRKFVAEAWVAEPDRLANYVRSDALHTAFNFEFLKCPWDAARLRAVIDRTMSSLDAVGAPATWVLSNHDVSRHVSRYGRPHDAWRPHADHDEQPADIALGTRRARSAALLALALPGGAYVYQGDELGLPDVDDLPESALQDPVWERTGHAKRGRDGSRVPIPWEAGSQSFGFSPAGSTAESWLPQPDWMGAYAADLQRGVDTSMLELYRTALGIRRDHPALGDGTMSWAAAPEGILRFDRPPGFTCIVNLSGQGYPVPSHQRLLLASGDLHDDDIPPDTAVWLD